MQLLYGVLTSPWNPARLLLCDQPAARTDAGANPLLPRQPPHRASLPVLGTTERHVHRLLTSKRCLRSCSCIGVLSSSAATTRSSLESLPDASARVATPATSFVPAGSYRGATARKRSWR